MWGTEGVEGSSVVAQPEGVGDHGEEGRGLVRGREPEQGPQGRAGWVAREDEDGQSGDPRAASETDTSVPPTLSRAAP